MTIQLTRTERLASVAAKLFTVILAARTGQVVVPIIAYFGIAYTIMWTSRTFIVKEDTDESL